ncbi:MAG TPA: cellulase family glycosylhydrolase [Microbacterium sp.]|uniref:glycoside hydrolase family 5 protein n=1 Tax=Microbacterium sp. TaxID=51671 RepID=UPI002BDE929A|nr:cellulase family glycosylhydrolase [Microbacterium sp.]HWI31649.1 cellulase family glycosylhydrolase [Microbacterium sp.]
MAGSTAALVAVLAMLVAIPAHAPVVPPGIEDPSGGTTAGARTDDEALRFGDGSYLNGHDYLRGVNIYSLVFAGKQADPTALGEPQSSYDYLASRGVSIVRLAVPWQRLQEIPEGGGALDGLAAPVSTPYLDAVEEQVRRAAAAGIRTIIDLHNGCTYPWGAGAFVEGSVRCGDGISEAHVSTIWTSIAERFRGDERVAAFDIFNEPRWSVGVDVYKRYAQVAVDAIRATGDQHTLWVEGILSDTRGRVAAIAPDGPWIADPLGKVMYSEHFYDNEAGDSFDPGVDHTRVLERLSTFARWCREWAVRCSVGEVGWPSGGAGGVQTAESGEAWNDLFERFYAIADEYELDVTYFAASSVKQVGTLLAYVGSEPGLPSPSGIDTALSQAEVIERHPSRPSEESGLSSPQ